MNRPAALVILLFTSLCLSPISHAGPTTRIIVMPFKLVGDLDARQDGEHKQRLAMANKRLREGLLNTQRYDLVDEAAAADFTQKVTTALGNNNCDKCESALAKELNARQILVPWVYRLSQLVLTMHFDVIDADSGKIILKKALDFRGDNDQSWQRAIKHFVSTVNKP